MRKIALLCPAAARRLRDRAGSNCPVHGETPGHNCTAARDVDLSLASRNDETGAAILAATRRRRAALGAARRMLTMDFRADRVTVRLGRRQRIIKTTAARPLRRSF